MFVAFLCFLCLCSAEMWTVENTTSGLRVRRGSGGLASAEWRDERSQNGWVFLDVYTQTSVFAAGYLEGFISKSFVMLCV